MLVIDLVEWARPFAGIDGGLDASDVVDRYTLAHVGIGLSAEQVRGWRALEIDALARRRSHAPTIVTTDSHAVAVSLGEPLTLGGP